VPGKERNERETGRERRRWRTVIFQSYEAGKSFQVGHRGTGRLGVIIKSLIHRENGSFCAVTGKGRGRPGGRAELLEWMLVTCKGGFYNPG